MNIKTSEKIIEYIKTNSQASGKELVDHLNISDRAVRKQLKNLLEKQKVYKVGKPPKVFYFLDKGKEEYEKIIFEKKEKDLINKNYLIITPSGERKEGTQGFIYWCRKNKLEPLKTAKEYIKTFNKYEKYKEDGIIKGTQKIKKTFSKNYLNEIYYIDFYSIERFGKTKLGQLLLYGKQSGDKEIIKGVSKTVKPQIKKILKKHKIEAIGFIPWTVKREVQFMKEFEKHLNLNLVSLDIEKLKTEIMVPQKTLSKLDDRVENARETIIVKKSPNFQNILLIDDAIGSGSTLNETAKKLKERGIAQKVFGLSITGSFKGFEIISEV